MFKLVKWGVYAVGVYVTVAFAAEVTPSLKDKLGFDPGAVVRWAIKTWDRFALDRQREHVDYLDRAAAKIDDQRKQDEARWAAALARVPGSDARDGLKVRCDANGGRMARAADYLRREAHDLRAGRPDPGTIGRTLTQMAEDEMRFAARERVDLNYLLDDLVKTSAPGAPPGTVGAVEVAPEAVVDALFDAVAADDPARTRGVFAAAARPAVDGPAVARMKAAVAAQTRGRAYQFTLRPDGPDRLTVHVNQAARPLCTLAREAGAWRVVEPF